MHGGTKHGVGVYLPAGRVERPTVVRVDQKFDAILLLQLARGDPSLAGDGLIGLVARPLEVRAHLGRR